MVRVRDEISKYCNPEEVPHKALSQVSITSSAARARAAAAKAKFIAERQMLELKWDLDRTEQKINLEKERLFLDTQIGQKTA